MTKYICSKCGNNRWKTKIKDKSWECRNCGYIKGEQETIKIIKPVVSHAQETISIPKFEGPKERFEPTKPKKLKWWKKIKAIFK